VQATRTTFIPLLVSAHSDRVDPAAVRDEAFAGLAVVYTSGPEFGRRVVTHGDLTQLQIHPQMLRQAAFQHLEVLSSRAEFHGQPPALMLSFEGLESSLLLATDFWARLEGAVPGELIVGVPSRDCVVVTGSRSGPGLEKAKRCVERVFFAGGEHLIARGLLVRRGGAWEPFDRSARPSGRPQFGPAHLHGVGQPPRQYQEHPSWPGERIPPQAMGGRQGAPGRPGPVRRRPMHGVPPAMLDQTGSHRLDQTGSHRLDQTGSHRLDQTGSHRLDQTGSHRLGMTGFQPPVSAMPISAMPVSAMPVSREPEPAYPAAAYHDYSADVAEAAQYSAVPYSGAAYADDSHVMAPQSMSPAPYDAEPWHEFGATRDGYSTGSMPRVRDFGSAPRVSYPGSWGTAPESVSKVEFRSGPRARFS
jgi:hypothetical protein